MKPSLAFVFLLIHILFFNGTLAAAAGSTSLINLVQSYSPIVEIRGEFKGSGILFKLKDRPHILTASHVIFNHENSGQAKKIIQFKLSKREKSHFYTSQEINTTFKAELIFDDPIADFSLLEVKEVHSVNKARVASWDILNYWATKSFSLSSSKFSLAKNEGLSQWIESFFTNGLVGVDYLYSNRTVFTPMIASYQIETEADTVLFGLLKNQVRLAAFAKPGMSGSPIIKDRELYGLATKANIDGSPVVYGVTLKEIFDRYFKSIQKDPHRINSTSARWIKEASGNLYLNYQNDEGHILQRAVKLESEINANDKSFIGGDLGDTGGDQGDTGGDQGDTGGDQGDTGIETTNLRAQSNTQQEPKIWVFNSLQTTGASMPSMMSLANPFMIKKNQAMSLKLKDSKEVYQVGLIREVIDHKINYSLPSLMALNAKKIPILQSSTQRLNSNTLIFLNSDEYQPALTALQSLRQIALNGKKPKYFRYAYKLKSGFLCFDGIGNAFTRDNTMSVKYTDRNSLWEANRMPIEAEVYGTSGDIEKSMYHKTPEGLDRVSFFIFDLRNSNQFLNAFTDFGNHAIGFKGCTKQTQKLFPKMLKTQESSAKVLPEDFFHSEYEFAIDNINLNSFSLTQTINGPNGAQKTAIPLKLVSPMDSSFLRYESNQEMNNQSNSSYRALLVFDQNNLSKLERIYIDTPLVLFEFIYINIDKNNPR